MRGNSFFERVKILLLHPPKEKYLKAKIGGRFLPWANKNIFPGVPQVKNIKNPRDVKIVRERPGLIQ